MIIHIPEWLLWSVGTVAALVVLFFAACLVVVYRGLWGPLWK